MRRALLIGSPALGLDVGLALVRMQELLADALDFDSISTCTDDQATRTALLSALDAWICAAQPTDVCLLYYFGHGGQVRFTDGPAAGHRFGLITTTPELHDAEGYGCILDIELSAALARLDRRCHNVTALFDCCHSGELARGGKSRAIVGERPTPEWALAALNNPGNRDLAIESHPRIARLTGASPMRQAFTFAEERGGETIEPIGHLTRAFIDTVRASGPRWPELSWEVLKHVVRERVIAELGMESQWVNFAGPRNRRLFSREQAEPRRLIGFVPDAESPTHGWLRAGACSGVRVGDRSQIHALGSSEPIAAEVVEVELNRAKVSLSAGNLTIAGGAELVSVQTPEDRVARLLGAAGELPNDEEVPLQWTWGRVSEGGELEELDFGPAALKPDDRLWFRIDHTGTPPMPWFVSVVLVDADEHAHLLNARSPEGLELIPGEHQLLGIRHGVARQGFPLPGAPKHILLLACRRPIELGHLVAPHPWDFAEAFALQGMSADTDIEVRGASKPPVLANGWWSQRIDLR